MWFSKPGDYEIWQHLMSVTKTFTLEPSFQHDVLEKLKKKKKKKKNKKKKKKKKMLWSYIKSTYAYENKNSNRLLNSYARNWIHMFIVK